MKKNNHNKESLNLGENTGDFVSGIGSIPNPIPAWIEVFFKSYSNQFSVDINEGLIEGYPVDDDF